MKAAVLDGIPHLPGLVAVLVSDTNIVHFLFKFCTAIKCVHKTQHVYDSKKNVT